MSITVIPKNVSLSCTAESCTDGCSISLPAGLRANSTVTVSYPFSYHGWDHNTYSFSSGITANGLGAYDRGLYDAYVNAVENASGEGTYDGDFFWACGGEDDERGAVYCYMTGLNVGSTSIKAYRPAKYTVARYCNEQDGGQSYCGNDDKCALKATFSFQVTY